MRKKLLYTGMLIAAVALVTQLSAKPGSYLRTLFEASFNWSETVHDFGTIQRGIPVSHKFTFTNTGDAPLVITSVQASCGCTVTEYSKDPVPAGEKGYVNATYNAAAVGVFSKSVTVSANTPDGSIALSIKGVVKE